MSKKESPTAMAFYHANGLVPAWNWASAFAGHTGKIGSLEDVLRARCAFKAPSLPWARYFTTTTAEYFGRSKAGSRILIVAHDVGPMSTVGGIQQAYAWQFNDKDETARVAALAKQSSINSSLACTALCISWILIRM